LGAAVHLPPGGESFAEKRKAFILKQIEFIEDHLNLWEEEIVLANPVELSNTEIRKRVNCIANVKQVGLTIFLGPK